MKATGIVRRIDDLGRVVIPKEIRKTYKITEGSPLEIFTDNEGNIIFKKYSPVGEIANHAEIYAECISSAYSCACIISDTDKIIAVAGMNKKEFIGKNLSYKMREFIENKRQLVSNEKMEISEHASKIADVTAVISVSGDAMGVISLLDFDEKKDTNINSTLKMLANILAKQAN